jgi:hypothetical protein
VREDLSQMESTAKKVAAQVEALKVEAPAPSRISLLEEAAVSNADGLKRRMMATWAEGGCRWRANRPSALSACCWPTSARLPDSSLPGNLKSGPPHAYRQ